MEIPDTFEKILIGIVVVVVLLWFRPGMKAMMEQSRDAEERDWLGFLLPIGLVVVFVMVILYLV